MPFSGSTMKLEVMTFENTIYLLLEKSVHPIFKVCERDVINDGMEIKREMGRRRKKDRKWDRRECEIVNISLKELKFI